ncbi:GNAT family N-acetyltransferase [Alteribacillus sp. HJP-4]|uniref:GNAT family N-acetyltransferase n=1 Tax=Alteribacillus sp. HJP-4 TaxID=2775394 RepID=UPI0035CD2D6B
MYIEGKEIFVKAAEQEETGAVLELEKRNKEFFQQFTGLKEESFYTIDGQLKRIRTFIQEAKEDKGYLFFICLKKTEEVIGEIMLTEVVRQNLQSCWIGYFLNKDHNGRGYMSEAVKLVVNHAFRQLSFHRIEAGVMPHNIGSMKVLLKAGFHKEGIARKNVCINGKWEDHQTLAIINEEE